METHEFVALLKKELTLHPAEEVQLVAEAKHPTQFASHITQRLGEFVSSMNWPKGQPVSQMLAPKYL